MKALGMDTVILQHATYGNPGDVFYAPNTLGLPAPSGDLFGQVLRAADALGGMRIMLGLGYRDDWKYEGGATLQAYAALTRFNLTVAGDLVRNYGRSPSWWGWYLPQEADSQRTWEPVSAGAGTPLGRLLDGYYRPVMQRLKELAPDKPIAIAPFFGYGAMEPKVFGAWWELLLRGCPVDILMMQDGIGVYHATLAPHPGSSAEGPPFMQVDPYLTAARDACRRAGKSFWLDLEAFREVRDDESVPATWEAATIGGRPYPGLREQLQHEAPLVHAGGPCGDRIICYEFLEDLSPTAGGGNQAAAITLNRAYHAFIAAP